MVKPLQPWPEHRPVASRRPVITYPQPHAILAGKQKAARNTPADMAFSGGKQMNLEQLEQVARAMVADGKGILAADESTPTIKKRFDTINTESTEDNRRSYREMLFTTAGA